MFTVASPRSENEGEMFFVSSWLPQLRSHTALSFVTTFGTSRGASLPLIYGLFVPAQGD